MESSETPQPARPTSHLSEELKQLAETASTVPGINLAEVAEGDILLFSTRKSLYTFRVEKPARHNERVLCSGEVQGGYFELPASDVEILGSTVKGGALLTDQAKENMRLQFRVPLSEPDAIGRKHKVVTTSPLESIKKLDAAKIGT